MTNSSKQAQGAIISELFAGKWTLSIIEALGSETKRHSELNRSLPGVAQKVLTVTLRRLERYGIVHRKVYPTVPPQVEYKLTQIGLELLNLSVSYLTGLQHTKKIYDGRKDCIIVATSSSLPTTSVFRKKRRSHTLVLARVANLLRVVCDARQQLLALALFSLGRWFSSCWLAYSWA